MAEALQIPRVFPRGSCYESVKAIQSPIQGLKWTDKVDKSRAMPAYAPGVTPPPPPPPTGTAADKYITHYQTSCSEPHKKNPAWFFILAFLLDREITPISYNE